MKTSLDHLPASKQRDLERVVQIIFEEFADALAVSTSDWKKKGRIDKIILYGSYARGGWVDEPHTAKGFQSDFDLLIIVKDKRLTDRAAYWSKLDERLIREFAITKTIHVPVNYILHTLQEVNDGLAHGRYFFMDVKRDGIVLYESDQTELHEPKPKTPEQALKMAKAYFEEWFPSAAKFKKASDFLVVEEGLREAAFNLHQAAERLYHCVQMMYLKNDIGRYRTTYLDRVRELQESVPGSSDLIAAVNHHVTEGSLYKALKEIRKLMKREDEERTAA